MSRSIIANVLKQQRKNLKMTVDEVCENLASYGIELSKNALYNYESGYRQPDADTLMALCEIYEVEDILDAFGYKSTVKTEEAPSCSDEAMKLAHDYDGLDSHGKRIVRVVTDEEMARISAEIKNMREQLETAQDMIGTQKIPTPVSEDGLEEIFMCFASGLNQGQQQMFRDWLQNMTKSQQQSPRASAPQIVGETVPKVELPNQS